MGRKKFWKMTGLVLAGTLLCSLIAGCSAGTDGKGAASSSDVNVDESKKEKITVAIYDRGNLNPEEGTMDQNRWTEWINANAPVEVEFIAIPRWTSADKYSALLASNSAPDLILEYDSSLLQKMITNGSLMPIGDLVDQYSTTYKELLNKYSIMEKMGTVNGELYLFARTDNPYPNHVAFIRQDWLDKLGLSMPETSEELYDVAEAFAMQDPDGNGQNDTYGYSLSFVGGRMLEYMFGLGTQGRFLDDGTEFNYAWDRMKSLTQFKKNLFENGIVNKDYAADSSGEQATQDFISGKLGIIVINNAASISGQKIIENFYENNQEGQLEVMQVPSSEYGQYNTAINPPTQVVGGINANCKNPEAVIKYIDWLNSSEDIYNTLKYGGEEYSVKNEAGAWIPREQKVFEKEVYGTDFIMPISSVEFDIDLRNQFDSETDIGRKMIKIYEDAQKYYVDCDFAFTRDVLAGLPRPALSPELTLIYSNTYGNSVVNDNWEKAVVSGSDYTVEQAEADNRKLIEEGDGKQILDFYQSWYKEAADAGSLITEEDFKVFK